MEVLRTTRRPPRWVAMSLLALWGVVLAVAGFWSSQHDAPTVRAQSPLAEGRAALDRAVTIVVSAAGPGVTAEVGEYQITEDCRLSLTRRGTAVTQEILMTVAEGEEQALLDRLAQRVPESWEARSYPTLARFHADAGHFVRVDGEVAGAGKVRVTVNTGCRPGEDPELSRD